MNIYDSAERERISILDSDDRKRIERQKDDNNSGLCRRGER
jgi:hypothetical protein